jgi:hypothetical protein
VRLKAPGTRGARANGCFGWFILISATDSAGRLAKKGLSAAVSVIAKTKEGQAAWRLVPLFLLRIDVGDPTPTGHALHRLVVEDVYHAIGADVDGDRIGGRQLVVTR